MSHPSLHPWASHVKRICGSKGNWISAMSTGGCSWRKWDGSELHPLFFVAGFEGYSIPLYPCHKATMVISWEWKVSYLMWMFLQIQEVDISLVLCKLLDVNVPSNTSWHIFGTLLLLQCTTGTSHNRSPILISRLPTVLWQEVRALEVWKLGWSKQKSWEFNCQHVEL